MMTDVVILAAAVIFRFVEDLFIYNVAGKANDP